jgi:DNA (cytosine-5)-methyltransferase 1
MTTRKPTAIDLFAGCGGVTEGLRQAGFHVIAAVEVDPVTAKTYRLNHPKVYLSEADIRDIKGRKWMRELGIKRGGLDLLVGCPPCQGFSTLRTRNGAHWNRDRRNYLVEEMLRLVKELRPKAVMMENVPRLKEKRIFREFARSLAAMGYSATSKVVDVQRFAVPQRRRRLVLVAGRGFKISFPKEARIQRTVKTAIKHLKRAGASGDSLHDMPENRSKWVRDIIARVPKSGGSRLDLPKRFHLKCHKGFDGFKDVYGRMAWNEVAPTITGGCFNPSKGRFLHPSCNRNITMREAALLQTFPKRYKFDVSDGKQQIALMIGNALPPELVKRQAVQAKRALFRAKKGDRSNVKRRNSKKVA